MSVFLYEYLLAIRDILAHFSEMSKKALKIALLRQNEKKV